MCAQLGVIFGTARRGRGDQEHRDKLLGWLFTYLLLLSEKRGPHATGVALLKSNGEHVLFKRPLKASDFIKDKRFREVLNSIDACTTLLMGHTRWQTVGDASNNENNHPIRAGQVIGTHNGTIFNADELFDLLGLPRRAEVDSELIFRIADATLDDGRFDACGDTRPFGPVPGTDQRGVGIATGPSDGADHQGQQAPGTEIQRGASHDSLRFGCCLPRRGARQGERVAAVANSPDEPDDFSLLRSPALRQQAIPIGESDSGDRIPTVHRLG